MNDLKKSGIFGGAALVALALAVYASLPNRFGKTGEDANAPLFPNFTDPGLAQSMEIVKYDEETSRLYEFKVARTKDAQGREMWRIPSHHNYPADANTQLAGAASALVGRERGSKIGSSKELQEKCGVRDPKGDDLSAGARGVGTLVVLADENDKPLAELIIGKEVPERSKLRYVRVRGQDAVYQMQSEVTIPDPPPSKSNSTKTLDQLFSTKFEEWIVRDPMQLDRKPIQLVVIRDLGLRQVGPGTLAPVKGDVLPLRSSSSAEAGHGQEGAAAKDRWTLLDEPVGTELEETKLNDLRDALFDLRIVDVYPKPPALARVLSGKGKIETQQDFHEINESLQTHGFYLTQEFLKDHEEGVFPSDGEVVVQMQDGREYRLRFGSIAQLTADQSEAARKKEAEAKKVGDQKDGEKKEGDKKDPKATGSNRYMYVSLVVNRALIEKPTPKPLPGESFLPTEGKDGATDGDAKTTPKKATPADALRELQRLESEGLIDANELKARSEQVNRDNAEAQRNYDAKVAEVERKAKELNERFAEWYFVIDDQMYKKIRVKRNEIKKGAKEKEAAKDGKEASKEPGSKDAAKDAGAKETGGKEAVKGANDSAAKEAADAKTP